MATWLCCSRLPLCIALFSLGLSLAVFAINSVRHTRHHLGSQCSRAVLSLYQRRRPLLNDNTGPTPHGVVRSDTLLRPNHRGTMVHVTQMLKHDKLLGLAKCSAMFSVYIYIYIYTGSFKKIWTSSTLSTEVTGPDTLWFFPMGLR